MFKIAQASAWSLGTMPARPIRLGQSTCPITGCPVTRGIDKAAAKKYAELLAKTLGDHPECFDGEDLVEALASENRLMNFSAGFAWEGVAPAQTYTLTEADNRVIGQALNCPANQAAPVTEPAPVTPKPPENATTPVQNATTGQQPTTIKTLQTPTPAPAGTLPQAPSQETSIVPIAVGAAAALAIIWAALS